MACWNHLIHQQIRLYNMFRSESHDLREGQDQSKTVASLTAREMPPWIDKLCRR
jgi:hypothetical protein